MGIDSAGRIVAAEWAEKHTLDVGPRRGTIPRDGHHSSRWGALADDACPDYMDARARRMPDFISRMWGERVTREDFETALG